MSDDAVVWADYHHDEIDKRDRRIAELEEKLKDAEARLWVLEQQRERDRLTAGLKGDPV